jgi:hypothetical protein
MPLNTLQYLSKCSSNRPLESLIISNYPHMYSQQVTSTDGYTEQSLRSFRLAKSQLPQNKKGNEQHPTDLH